MTQGSRFRLGLPFAMRGGGAVVRNGLRVLRRDDEDRATAQSRFSTTFPAMMTSFRRATPVIGS